MTGPLKAADTLNADDVRDFARGLRRFIETRSATELKKPESGKRESRIAAFDLEVRADGENGAERIHGHAAVFNTLSEDLGGFREKIAPGAFSKTIQEADVRALFNHDPNFVLGRNKAGTLDLSEDETGLKTVIDLPDTTFARDLKESVKRGDINQMSFGFRVVGENGELWEQDAETNMQIRTLLEVELFDVSLVTYPAYPDTDAGVRNHSSLGVDFSRVAEIASRAEAGKDLSTSDRAILGAASQALRTILEDAPVPADHAEEEEEDEDEARQLNERERRLKMAEVLS